MKNIVCPLSIEKVSEQIPRITAGLVISLLILYVITNLWIIPLVLVADFFIRGFGKGKYSVLGVVAVRIAEFIPFKGKLINKAPKIFAARLGFVFTSAIVLMHFLGLDAVASGVSVVLILFAGLECVANFCVGCWVYTLFVQPFYRN